MRYFMQDCQQFWHQTLAELIRTLLFHSMTYHKHNDGAGQSAHEATCSFHALPGGRVACDLKIESASADPCELRPISGNRTHDSIEKVHHQCSFWQGIRSNSSAQQERKQLEATA